VEKSRANHRVWGGKATANGREIEHMLEKERSTLK